MLDKALFEELFNLHFKHLCHFAKQYVKDDDSCQDVVQKVFISLWSRRADIDPQQGIVPYLFTAVKNRCLNHLRDHKKYRSHVLDLDCGDLEVVPPLVDHQLAVEELQEKIDAALDKLPEKCRLVFEMSRYRDMKYREIAQTLGISPKTVEAHMSKAINSLRKDLERYMTILITLLLL